MYIDRYVDAYIYICIYIYIQIALCRIIPIISRPVETRQYPRSFPKRCVATRGTGCIDRASGAVKLPRYGRLCGRPQRSIYTD